MRISGVSLALTVAFAVIAQPANANIFDTFAGIVKDPLKLGKLSDTVLEVLAQIDPLLGKADGVAQQRLNQVREIVDAAIEGGAAVEAKAISDLLNLEMTVMGDVNTVIFRARCAVITTANGTVQQAIAEALATIAKSRPSLTIGPFRLIDLTVKDVEIPHADQAYALAKVEEFEKLNKNVNDTTSAYDIISTYANLASLVEATRCYYLDQPNEITFIREQMQLTVKEVPWITVVSVPPTPTIH